MTVTRTIELADITPSELADLFCEMDGEEQARFFAGIKPIAAKWPGAGWCQQSHDIAKRLDMDGREIIEKLAEHVLGYDRLLEALRNIAEATSAEPDAGENYRWDDREGALDYAYSEAMKGLAAAREDAHVL